MLRSSARVLAVSVLLATLPGCGSSLRASQAPAFSEDATYRKPPKHILDVLRAPAPPDMSLAPTRAVMIVATPERFPPIATLAEPMLRLAGTRVVSTNRSRHAEPYWTDYVITKIADGSQVRVELPRDARLTAPIWSADGIRYAFGNTTADAVELWVGEATSPKVRRIGSVRLNAILGDAVQWMSDQKTLIVKLVPSDQGEPPAAPKVPAGPNVKEASGEKGPSSTYEVRDVLKTPHDAALFDYYATSQLALIDVERDKITPIGKPALYTDISGAPGGGHILVESVHRPYSYLTTYERFPREVEVWDRRGTPVHWAASLPLADSVPIAGVPTGPRSFMWRPTEPATLLWVEALDGGDWNRKVTHRDRIMMRKAPFAGQPVEVIKTEQRFGGFWWSERGDLTLVRDYDRIRHWTRTMAVNLDDSKVAPRMIWNHSSDERYKNPGTPVMRVLPNGQRVMWQDGDNIYLRAEGASPEGDRPFLDRFDLKTLKVDRLFRSEKTAYETFLDWYDAPGRSYLTRRESSVDPPNVLVRTLGKPVADASAGESTWTSSLPRLVTHVADTTPVVRGITKRLVKYKRADGVDLSFTLYLPPNYKEGTRLPAVFWAYPLDYAEAQTASQVTGSAQRYTVLGWPLHLFFALDGYAIIDGPSMPVVGDPMKMYDTYMDQLVAGAKAAVDKAVELGVVDPDRIGVTGHSHGGLMTANLLAHSELFRAGIARSGAYNRSLTAFGFQSERRTLWEATDVYVKVSPFFSAHKIKTPLMLIHGEMDANPGTTPMQSERFFEAIRGNGGTARLVMLPFEAHRYRALETTEHVLHEMLTWFDRHVKNAPARVPSAPASKAK